MSLAFGLTVLTMAYAIGHISGCHLNPAVTIGLWTGKRIPASDILPYIVAQVLGAIGAAAPATLAAGHLHGTTAYDMTAWTALALVFVRLGRQRNPRLWLAVGVVVTSIADPFNGEVIAGIESMANENGYSVILANSQADPEREVAVVRSVRERRVDGIHLGQWI